MHIRAYILLAWPANDTSQFPLNPAEFAKGPFTTSCIALLAMFCTHAPTSHDVAEPSADQP